MLFLVSTKLLYQSLECYFKGYLLAIQNQLALEKDRYKIHLAFIAAQENSLIVSDNEQSMLDASRAGGDFHLRTATNMYPRIHEAVEKAQLLPRGKIPLLQKNTNFVQEVRFIGIFIHDAFAPKRKKAKMLNFVAAYERTTVRLAPK
ncbi:DNA polymerase I B, chloroplastic/mitochondrial-like isoform X1 [Nicotiana tabacum]|uniref:DNA polymerase I B, chloroplastic/mitochondrial-like isoform X1 n=1 Tax=Nicotiana tabacum TaxID=4097 RepID=A0A1S4AE38_TOBAC|nr:PREDICTED: DNA polymerase I B, chloroplastic/mitochondrial-like isoform X1 [Nicotiana tabacum]XP_016474896.1 PREDICTED: DNA polymerase I B, chloroplastic/mitochondrial-like isoform X1 [Nicotiana tabacum]